VEILEEEVAYPGNQWAFAHQVKQTVDGVTSNFDLTGATLEATVSGSPGWTGAPAVIDAVTGKIEVQVPPATTVQYGPGTYLCDVLVTKPVGVPRTSVRFWVVVKPVGSLP
jgi:hypothetical protein